MSSSVVFKVLGPAATVTVGAFIAVQNYLYRQGVKDDVKELKYELKKHITKVTNAMNQMDGNLRAEIRCMGGKDRIDSLEAREVKLENRVEGLNTKMEKLYEQLGFIGEGCPTPMG